MVQVGGGDPNTPNGVSSEGLGGGGFSQNGMSPVVKKSPSFHSNKSENMSVANSNSAQNIQPDLASPMQHTFTVPSYEDHWAYEKIVLERVSHFWPNLVSSFS